MTTEENRPASHSGWLVELLGGGAAGVGVVLVLLPTLAIVLGAVFFKGSMIVGLPVLAILGIMILLGTLSLVAMLFKRLELADPRQPLALPPGSMRATISLSLIVLFAIFSITLYLSISNNGTPYTVSALREADRNALVMATPSRVILVEDDQCASGDMDACPAADRRYKVTLRAASSSEGVDFAKQLLVLVGTLMTSVTSYYFATRASAETDKSGVIDPALRTLSVQRVNSGVGGGTALTSDGVDGGGSASAGGAGTTTHAHVADDADGCDVEILDATADEHLPLAIGGVAPTTKEA